MTELPPGYRFFPTEEELICFYLRNKLNRMREEEMERVIPVVQVYSMDPWNLPQISRSGQNYERAEQWFFFCQRQEREIHGGRPGRITPSGYWKATGSPSLVYSSNNRVIGEKKTMAFYQGRAPTGTKTKWKMNEYKASDEDAFTAPPQLRSEFSLCRIYINSGSIRNFDRRPSGGVQIGREEGQVVAGASSGGANVGEGGGGGASTSHQAQNAGSNEYSGTSYSDDDSFDDIHWQMIQELCWE